MSIGGTRREQLSKLGVLHIWVKMSSRLLLHPDDDIINPSSIWDKQRICGRAVCRVLTHGVSTLPRLFRVTVKHLRTDRGADAKQRVDERKRSVVAEEVQNGTQAEIKKRKEKERDGCCWLAAGWQMRASRLRREQTHICAHLCGSHLGALWELCLSGGGRVTSW